MGVKPGMLFRSFNCNNVYIVLAVQPLKTSNFFRIWFADSKNQVDSWPVSNEYLLSNRFESCMGWQHVL